jgi:hypothetical protein
MNPIVVLLGLTLILANLLVSPQGKLLLESLGSGGPASTGASFPGLPGRGVPAGGGVGRVVPVPGLPPVGLPAGGGAPALPPAGLPVIP